MKQFIEDLENNMKNNSHIVQCGRVNFSLNEKSDCPIVVLNGMVRSYYQKQLAQTIVINTLRNYPELILKTINEIEVKND